MRQKALTEIESRVLHSTPLGRIGVVSHSESVFALSYAPIVKGPRLVCVEQVGPFPSQLDTNLFHLTLVYSESHPVGWLIRTKPTMVVKHHESYVAVHRKGWKPPRMVFLPARVNNVPRLSKEFVKSLEKPTVTIHVPGVMAFETENCGVLIPTILQESRI